MTTISRRPGRRIAAVLAILLSAALTASACGVFAGGDGDSASGSTAGYPVTVQSSHGPVTLRKKPERIVVLGSAASVDILAALGRKPVVFGSSYPDEKQSLAVNPWIKGLYGEYDAKLFNSDYLPDREAVAAHKPDLIIFFGGQLNLDDQQYTQLSEVAPVYEFSRSPDWRDGVRDLATFTGRSGQAQKVIDGIAADFAAARNRLPGLQGKTFFVGFLQENGSMFTYSAAARFFTDLGMTPAGNMPVPPEPRTDLSAENLDQVTADVVLLNSPPSQGSKEFVIQKDPRYAELPSVRNGTMIFLYPLFGGGPPTQIGPSMVPWYLQRLMPSLENSKLNGT